MRERRKNQRARCRIRCQIGDDTDPLRGLIMDVSDGGLCLLSPRPFELQEALTLRLEHPKHGPIRVESMAWHVRRVQGSTTKKRAWSIGVVIVNSDDAYVRLLADAGVGPDADFAPDAGVEPDAGAETKAGTAPDAGVAPNAGAAPDARAARASVDAAQAPSQDPHEAIADELTVFKIRIKERVSPRTRLVSLTAKDEAQARHFAEVDLDHKWSIVEVRRA